MLQRRHANLQTEGIYSDRILKVVNTEGTAILNERCTPKYGIDGLEIGGAEEKGAEATHLAFVPAYPSCAAKLWGMPAVPPTDIVNVLSAPCGARNSLRVQTE